jgi:hypothetical protein
VEPECEVVSRCGDSERERFPMVVFKVWLLLVIEHQWRELNRLALTVNAPVKTHFGEDARVETRGPTTVMKLWAGDCLKDGEPGERGLRQCSSQRDVADLNQDLNQYSSAYQIGPYPFG